MDRAEEHDIDDDKNHTKVPLLLNQADSSQFNTIIDVVDGKNIARVLREQENLKQ